ncbi:hypothetical protein [Roseateles sp.]|uniref:hypothetical protein n=1 Tax=Roseateles sp. TaxID=1971397 RepID=UPI0031D8674B
MSLLAKGYRTKQAVPPGRVLRVICEGSASVKVGAAAATTITATSQDYGPYATTTVVIVTAVSGPLDVQLLPRDMREVVTSASAPTNNDGRPDGTVYIQG